MFYIAQLIGTISLILLILSFQKNDKKTLLKYQIISSLCSSIQYVLLNAISGFFMNITMCIRNIIFSRYKNDDIPKIYLIIVIIIMLALSMLSYNGPISLLPCIGSLIYTVALAKYSLKVTRITNSITCVLYIIYNIKVLAIAGIIAASVELTSTLYAIYKFDIKYKKESH